MQMGSYQMEDAKFSPAMKDFGSTHGLSGGCLEVSGLKDRCRKLKLALCVPWLAFQQPFLPQTMARLCTAVLSDHLHRVKQKILHPP